jgi:peptide/nickel transport system substrate-binding protein
MTRRLAVVAGGAALVLLAASAGGAATKPVLTIGDSTGACGSFNPNGSEGFPEARLAYEPMIRRTPKGTFVPALATSWRIKPGNKVITFTLRHDARFSDGTRVDAQAIKTWLDWHKQIPYGSSAAARNV